MGGVTSSLTCGLLQRCGCFSEEKHHMRMVLRTNGYPEHVIQAAARPRKKKTTPEEQLMDTIWLPQVAGAVENLR